MNALDQYIKLYTDNSAAIDAHAPALLNSIRPAALAALDGARLPQKGDETFAALSEDAMFAPDYGVNINRVRFGVDTVATFHCGMPNVSTLMGLVVNDSFAPTDTLLRNLPAGVTVMSLAAAAKEQPDLVDRYLGKLAPLTSPSVALNTLLLQDGVFIHVARGVVLDKPIQLVNIFNAAAPLMGVRRLLIVLDEGASVSLLTCDHSQIHDISYLSSQVVEIFLGENATLDYYDLEESSEHTSRLSQLYASQKSGSNLNINGTTLAGGVTRNEYTIDISGDGAFSTLSGMAIGAGDQIIDTLTDIRHLSRRSSSAQMFKYMLEDKSTGNFHGRILVDEAAIHTDARQTNRNVLASDDARMYTRPQLEIYCDEVKCSHGATVGQLDAAALFYMRSRGIPENEARLMLMQAFMADVIDSIRIPSLKTRMQQLVESRLSGRHVLCSDCKNL